jgi:nitroreductase
MNGRTATRENTLNLVRQAVLAPSSHNTQPWRFRIAGDAIDLFADRTRALPVNDPEDRELVISSGAALLNLRVAAANLGREARLTLLPDPADADWLARLEVGGPAAVFAADAALAAWIERRRTYRRRFAPREVEAQVLERLVAAANSEGAALRAFTAEASRQAVTALVAEGDEMQWASPSWRRELAMWMHPRRMGDGLAVPDLVGPVAQFVVRTFDMGGGVGARDRDLAAASPLLAAIVTRSDTPRDWLQAGQALQRLLLTACREGLQASYLNQPIEVAPLRPKLQRLAGDGMPQILMRLGYPPDELPAAPRRPLADVIEHGA